MNTIAVFRRLRLAFFEFFLQKQVGKKGSPARLCAVPFASFMFYACSFSSLFGVVVSLNVFLMFLRAEKQCCIKSQKKQVQSLVWPVHTLIKLLSGARNNKTDFPNCGRPLKHVYWTLCFGLMVYFTPFELKNASHFNKVFFPQGKTSWYVVGIFQLCETGPCESCLVADDCLFL